MRRYVEKKPGFDINVKHLQTELAEVLDLPEIALRLFNRYDVRGISQADWEVVANTVLSEPVCDNSYFALPDLPGWRLLHIEPLPGQFVPRADSAEQCMQMLLGGVRPMVKTAKVYAVSGVSDSDFERVKAYLINPLENREGDGGKCDFDNTKNTRIDDIPEVPLDSLGDLGLAMSDDDIEVVRSYFKSEKRNPTLTEIRVIDTYWSDHCRHTTFNTIIKSADIEDERVKKAYELFKSVNGERTVTFMNMATAAMRCLRERGELPLLDESEENNACTIRVNCGNVGNNNEEKTLLFFKNETHNHPTEIEPYGGASTCIGGAIRDPLSGRAYVYQAMRISGSGDPRKPICDTMPGKLPQRKLTVTAAEGFSSYGNQIGIATGFVKEIYHDGYIAKRLEAGAVVGAVSMSAVKRERPCVGDAVVLLGGRTGRDGIGGATGSSKIHNFDTVSECGAQVQKGNPPEERKLQRLFRNPNVIKLIKRCNDFGAGGASVAIGELAGGVEINLDRFPLKYTGLNGTEIAVSESQERMAVVVASHDTTALIRYAEAENIEAVVVADITDNNRLVMTWRGKKIVDIGREFLDTNGAKRYADVFVPTRGASAEITSSISAISENVTENELNNCSQKGLVERFDCSIGAGNVFMPFGGKYALSESQVMAAIVPAAPSSDSSSIASVIAYGFNPHFTESDPFGGSAYAVSVSVAKLVAAGVSLDTVHLSLQEYFPRVNEQPKRWGVVFSAMLGAFSAQMGLGIAAIGGKDSMSGSYEEIDVPPTLISFAFGTGNAELLVSPEFKRVDKPVYIMRSAEFGMDDFDYAKLRTDWLKYGELVKAGSVLSACVCEGELIDSIRNMSLGNMIGFELAAGNLNDT
ncbi:MAG: phosphoribosylformylglycinamidine synthase, partial [Oscillospiraceae bacterium]|nr:phosphoribosylformylglycinamidine synthase [Oscillospiraceae bacterium]